MSTLPYPNPQAVFQMQYESVRRDEVVGVLLAFFLGGFGIHHFYLGRNGWGILYCCFFWTPIPWLLGFIECFLMPGRVRMYNAIRAAGIAASLGIAIPGYVTYPGWAAPGFAAPPPVMVTINAAQPADGTLVACPNCQHANAAGARFCAGCGNRLG